jgi:hypothetical protein
VSQAPREPLLKQFRRALEDDAAAARMLGSLSPAERAVAVAYRRYGGSVDGEVIRLDLMARGLMEIVTTSYPGGAIQRQWKRNLIAGLADRWVLLPESYYEAAFYSPYTHGSGLDRPFPRYNLHAGIAQRVEPAGPAPWAVPPATGTPEAIIRRSAAEVALDLSRVFAHLASRGSARIRADGNLAVPTLRALEKAVPLEEGPDHRPPQPHGLYVDLLRYTGMLRNQSGTIVADPAVAARKLARPGFWQVDSWARGWLSARNWFDGRGIPDGRAIEDSAGLVRTGREVLAWALGCLARAGEHWYELETFLDRLHALQGSRSFLPYTPLAWDPKLAPAQDKEKQGGEARLRAWWFSKEGAWYANAVMVTLVELGLVERARLGRGPAAPLGFRLTEPGRSVFGAPEVAPPPEPADGRCLVIQPNYDIVAYLDQADARTAALLGRIAESGSAHSGPIQTFRLTQASVYQAEEGGLEHAQIVAFLRDHSQRDLPANVVRSLADWSGKREGLALRSGITLVAFATTADRDAYLSDHPGTPCGERFVLGPGSWRGPPLPGSLVSDHLGDRRRTLDLDEQGHARASQPVDLVQVARLARIARRTVMGWQLSGESMRQAAAGGMKPGVVHQWLADHLAHPPPPLMAAAIDAWLKVGRSRPLELADAVLLHVPDGDQFRAIATSRRLEPFLLARPGPGWLPVKKEARKELAAILEGLGFTLSRELTADQPRAAAAPPGTPPREKR